MRKLERERNRRSISYAAQSNPVQPSPTRSTQAGDAGFSQVNFLILSCSVLGCGCTQPSVAPTVNQHHQKKKKHFQTPSKQPGKFLW